MRYSISALGSGHLPGGYELATDAHFRELSNFTTPVRAGRITAIEASGQVRVETDDAEGGDVLAWPLNGFTYAVGDVVFVDFAVNHPESAIVIGSKGATPELTSGGISFGNERLANFDTGTWTPTLTASTPGTLSTGYSIRTGRYTRLGDLVFVTFFVRTSGYSAGTASGEVHISGLPFTASLLNVNIMAFVAVANGITWPGSPIDTACEVPAGSAVVRFFSNQGAGARQYVGPGAVSASSDINGTLFYWV